MSKPDDRFDAMSPGNCVNYRLRRAARLTAKRYDEALRPSGLKNTQFTLLASLSHQGPISIGDLAELLAIDATTLTRNLDLLVRRGLVRDFAAGDARVREVGLTEDGKRALDQATPLWRAVQAEMLAAIGNRAWPGIQEALTGIEPNPS